MREDDVDQGSGSECGKEWSGKKYLLSASMCGIREGEE